MKLTVHHETTYRFDQPIKGVVQALRLTPSVCESQSTLEWSAHVEGAIEGARFRDGAGDMNWIMSIREPVSEFTIMVNGVIETKDLSGILRGHRESVPPLAYMRDTRATALDVALTELAADTLKDIPGAEHLARAHALSGAVAQTIAYKPGETQSHTTAAEALAQGAGVCQDHAHALIAVARASGIPARYVVGYLNTDSDGASHEASHAWAELHVSGLGWIGFDPANECCPDDRYIRLCSGFDAQDASPIRGQTMGSGAETLEVSVAVYSAQQ